MRLLIRVLPIFLAICISVACGGAPQKIIGGENAESGEFPFQISIQYNRMHICGGVIINEKWVLSVAHCVTVGSVNAMVKANDLKILTGINLNYNEGISKEYNVCRIIAHKDYHSKNLTISKTDEVTSIANDIAILEVAGSILLNSVVNRIDLPKYEFSEIGKVIFSAFGSMNCSYQRVHQQLLQKVEMRAITNKQCQMSCYETAIYPEHICAVHPIGYCASHGDSGSALITENGTLVGLLSMGNPEIKIMPDIFTRVHSYLAWIRQVEMYLTKNPKKKCRKSHSFIM